MGTDLTNQKTLDDPVLVELVAAQLIPGGFITHDWHRPFEKAALTQAKRCIGRIKRYLQACDENRSE